MFSVKARVYLEWVGSNGLSMYTCDDGEGATTSFDPRIPCPNLNAFGPPGRILNAGCPFSFVDIGVKAQCDL